MTIRCPVCGERFETEREFVEHAHDVPDAWEGAGAGFECPTCGARFAEEEELVRHQAGGHPDSPEG